MLYIDTSKFPDNLGKKRGGRNTWVPQYMEDYGTYSSKILRQNKIKEFTARKHTWIGWMD